MQRGAVAEMLEIVGRAIERVFRERLAREGLTSAEVGALVPGGRAQTAEPPEE